MRTTRRVEEWFDAKAWGDEPFFIACGIIRPHVPFYAPRRFFEQYPKDGLKFDPVPTDDWDDIPELASFSRYKAFKMEIGVNEPKKRAHWMQGYHAGVSFADELVGRILKSLEENGLADDTIVVLFSDHGYTIGEHFMYGKVNMWEEVLRVPFAIRAPGVTQAGSKANGLIELVDIYPTLCELTGLPKPRALEGVSLVPMLRGEKDARGKNTAYTVVSRYPGEKPTSRVLGRSIRSGMWRYTEWGPEREQELYDLKNDPEQYTNLARKPQFGDRLKRLGKLLHRRSRRSGDF